MRYLLTALVLAAPLASGAAPANVCDVSDIIDCEALAKAPVDLSGTQGFPKFKDGRQIFNMLAAIEKKDTDEFIQSQQPTPKQLIDLKKNATRIKDRLRDFLKAGRSDDWIKKSTEPEAVELRAILSRIETLTIRVANDDDYECSIETPEGFPGAYNEPIRNTIMLCPATAKQSLPTLTRTLAHEIGHSLEPCAMEKPLFKIKSNKNLSENGCFENAQDASGEELSSLEVDRGIKRLMRSIRSGDVTSIVGPRTLVGDVVSCGGFEEVSEASVPRENRKLFGRAAQCINSSYASEYEAIIKQGAAEYVAMGKADDSIAEATLRADLPQECISRNKEHFADSFAARFTAHIAEVDQWSKDDLRISMMYDAAAVCATQANRPYLHPLNYPPAATRLSIALNEPIVRERLKCVAEPNSERLCSIPSDQKSGSRKSGMSPGVR